MQQGNPDQPPVILIHGALGSRLSDPGSGREIWPGSVFRLLFSDFGELALEIDPDTLTPQPSRLRTTGIADTAAGRDYYGRILRVLEEAGGYSRGVPGRAAKHGAKQFYVFVYDWRQDAVDSARELHEFIEAIREDYANPELRVDIIVHSLGGMITRYYARYGTADETTDNDFPVTQMGAERIRRVVLLGTPNLGSAAAFRTLVRGYDLGPNTIPAEVVATFPSTYQLLPHAINNWMVTASGKPLDRDQFDVEIWRRFGFSIFAPEVRGRIRARFESDKQAGEYRSMMERFFEKSLERARRFSWSLTVPVEQPRIRYIVFGSDCRPTPERVLVEEVKGKSIVRLFPDEVEYPIEGVDYDELMLGPGDGTVTKASLLARQTADPTVQRHEYSFFPLDYPLFLCEEHARLTGNIDFQNNLLHALLTVDP